jgi:hypothetical protein
VVPGLGPGEAGLTESVEPGLSQRVELPFDRLRAGDEEPLEELDQVAGGEDSH